VKVPKGIKGGRNFGSAEDFSEYLIVEKMLSTVPWDDAGAYVRFSVTFEAGNEAEEADIIATVKQRLSDVHFVF